MRDNLPPGVRVSDIPGNRPIDSAWERIEAEVDAMTVAEFCDRLGNSHAAHVEAARLWLVEAMVDQWEDARYDTHGGDGPDD